MQPPIQWPKVYAALDGHAIHSRTHAKKGKSETFRRWPPIIQAMLEKHKGYHDQLMIQQAAALQGGAPMPAVFNSPMSGAAGGSTPQTMNSSSSPARLGGDQAEMQRDMAATGGV